LLKLAVQVLLAKLSLLKLFQLLSCSKSTKTSRASSGSHELPTLQLLQTLELKFMLKWIHAIASSSTSKAHMLLHCSCSS
jgi:hypothetical protein